MGLTEDLKSENPIADSVRIERESVRLRIEHESLKKRYKHVCEELEAAENKINVLSGLDEVRTYDIENRPRNLSNATAIAVLSDWHVEEPVDPAKVNGRNEYSVEIASRRIKRTWEKILYLLESARHEAKINCLVVALLGDFLSGYIHPELVEENQLSPVEAIQFLEEHFVSGLTYLANKAGIKELIVVTAVGNHGRTTEKQRVSTELENSFETLLYSHVARHLRGESKIAWKLGTGYHNWLDVQGRPIRFHHGHAIRYGGGIGGPTIPIVKAIAAWDKEQTAYLDVFGHLHQWMHHRKFLMNGSLIGYSPFAVKIKADYEEPCQSFLVVDREYGVTIARKIFCERA